jgi:soluble lytic murein transglycosylase-like protein
LAVGETLAAILFLCSGASEPKDLARVVDVAAARHRVSPRLMVALMRRESRCTAGAVNDVTGAVGLFQVMPATATHLLLGKHASRRRVRLGTATLLDPALNAMLGAEVLARALRRCKGDAAGALSVYNGQGACVPSSFADDVLAFERSIPGT